MADGVFLGNCPRGFGHIVVEISPGGPPGSPDGPGALLLPRAQGPSPPQRGAGGQRG